MADAAFTAACLIYVLHTLGEPPMPAGKLGFGTFDDFGDFQTAVAVAVEKKGSFSDYKRRQLESGFFFVLPHPPDGSRPARPAGSGLVAGSVTLSSGDCILLDISSSLPAAGAAAAGAASGGGPAGLTLAELVAKVTKLEAQQAAVDADLLPVLQKGLFTVLDLEGHPICCGFFVRESGIALTVNHGHKRFIRPGGIVHAVMLHKPGGDGGGGAAAAAALMPDEVLLEFKVHSFSPPADEAGEDEECLDYTCLTLTSAVPAGTFQPLPLPEGVLEESRLTGAHGTLLHGSIALNRLFNKDPSASLVPCTIFTTHADRVLYTAATAGGDSGGALVLHGKMLVAMHVEGLNDVPGDVEVTSPRKGKQRAKRLRLSEASPSTTGAALRLDLPAVQAAIAAAHAATLPVAAAVGGVAAGAGGGL